MTRIKVGIVGLGMAVKPHALALREVGDRVEAEKLIVQRPGQPTFEVQGTSEGGGGADPMAFSHAAHRRLIEDFLDAIATGRAPRVSGRSGLGVQALIDAMLASSASGVPVDVADTRSTLRR